jgi:hypothetical protein
MNKRNPCTYKIVKYTSLGMEEEWSRGYVQDRQVKNQQYLISPGVGGELDERWYDYKDVKLTKGHWTNRSNKVVSKKSFWRKAK